MSSNIPSVGQIDALLSFLEQYPELARGRLRNVEGRLHSKKLWARLTNKLNSLEGCSKNVKQWQKVWADKKYLAKKAAAALRRPRASSEGGPSSAAPLSAQEQRIVTLSEEDHGDQDAEPSHSHLRPIQEVKVEASSPISSSDDGDSSDEEEEPAGQTHRAGDAPAQRGSSIASRVGLRRRAPESSRQTICRLIELEERRVALEAHRAGELNLIRESIQELSRVVQTSLQDIVSELRAQRPSQP